MAKLMYVKCGPKAYSFSDPYSQFTIVRFQIKVLESTRELASPKIKRALQYGHLERVSKEEYEKHMRGEVDPVEKPKMDFDDLTKKQLVKYYKDNYQVEDDEIVAFEKLRHAEMVAELAALEKEN